MGSNFCGTGSIVWAEEEFEFVGCTTGEFPRGLLSQPESRTDSAEDTPISVPHFESPTTCFEDSAGATGGLITPLLYPPRVRACVRIKRRAFDLKRNFGLRIS